MVSNIIVLSCYDLVMEITYLGHSSFKLKNKEGMVLITDPFESSFVGLPYVKDVADIVTLSHDHADHNARSMITGPVIREKTFFIDKEGEYEIGGIEIGAIQTYHDKSEGAERGMNLATVIRMDGLTVCHLGDLGVKLTEGQVEKLGDIDVLLVPVGGVYTIDAQEALEVIKDIQPSIVVPMHYKASGMADGFAGLSTLEQFLDKCKLPRLGEPVRKMRIEESSLPDDTQVLVMSV